MTQIPTSLVTATNGFVSLVSVQGALFSLNGRVLNLQSCFPQQKATNFLCGEGGRDIKGLIDWRLEIQLYYIVPFVQKAFHSLVNSHLEVHTVPHCSVPIQAL